MVVRTGWSVVPPECPPQRLFNSGCGDVTPLTCGECAPASSESALDPGWEGATVQALHPAAAPHFSRLYLLTARVPWSTLTAP
ncbi:hypothetical protein GCM10023086_42420 [Streptomyces venetus]|uniref:Uncharacterized protein n=1 Tax=Streptomyces venetus TaxID=1701086 RepID=A0ABP8G7W0_9ACTN